LISNHFGESVSGPEKAGVGGSIPSLATTPSNNLATLKQRVKFLARTIRAHRFALFSLLASLVQITSKFPAPCCLFWQCVGARPCHLDIRVGQDLCELLKIVAVHHVPRRKSVTQLMEAEEFDPALSTRSSKLPSTRWRPLFARCFDGKIRSLSFAAMSRTLSFAGLGMNLWNSAAISEGIGT
jgi:hypothetical protein